MRVWLQTQGSCLIETTSLPLFIKPAHAYLLPTVYPTLRIYYVPAVALSHRPILCSSACPRDPHPHPHSCAQEAKPFLDQNPKRTKLPADIPQHSGPRQQTAAPLRAGFSATVMAVWISRGLKEAVLRPSLFPDTCQTSGGLQLKGQTPPRRGFWAYILS